MPDAGDMELLRDYHRHGSEAAFAELVRRHIHLVYSVAARHVGMAAHAEEITQAVFIILARKAAGLRPDTILEGWLHETTRLTALSFLRGERRRQLREQEAYMQSISESGGDASSPSGGGEIWAQLAPLLDEALARLNKKDRDAVLLRFFKEQSVREVAAAMQVSEPAAQRRVLRAVEKLRQFFARRGVDSPADAITNSIAAHSIQIAPAALAKTVTAMALAKGAAASTSTLTLVTATLKAMTWAKVKFACGIGAAVLLAGGVVTVAVTSKTDNGERYKIEGEILVHWPAHDFITSQQPSHDDTRQFILTVNGRNWAVHLTDAQMHGIKYEEVVQLNGTIYRYDYYGTPPPGGSRNSGSAVIQRLDVPIEDGTDASFIWVGLASADYFAAATHGDVVSLWSGPRDAVPLKVKADWQLSDQPPYLPKSIDYYQGSEEHRPPPFENGWKETQMRVLEETNVEGKTFPLVYTVEQLWPKQTGAVTSNDLEQADIITVRVQSIQLDSVPDVLPPKTEGVTAVGETRFPNNILNKQTVYFSTLDRLPEKTEAAAIQEYNQRQKQAALHSTAGRRRLQLQHASNHKWIWLSVILVVSALAVIVGLVKRKRGN